MQREFRESFGGSENIISSLDLPWYARPAVIMGRFYPEISIKKIYKEDNLPPYLPKGKGAHT